MSFETRNLATGELLDQYDFLTNSQLEQRLINAEQTGQVITNHCVHGVAFTGIEDAGWQIHRSSLCCSVTSNYRQVPLGIVYSPSAEDIHITNEIYHRYQVPLLKRSEGTSQNGKYVNIAAILNCSHHPNRVAKMISPLKPPGLNLV